MVPTNPFPVNNSSNMTSIPLIQLLYTISFNKKEKFISLIRASDETEVVENNTTSEVGFCQTIVVR